MESFATYGSVDPTISSLTNSGFVVTWISYDGVQDTSGYGIKAQIFDASGEKVGELHTIDGVAALRRFETDVALRIGNARAGGFGSQ